MDFWGSCLCIRILELKSLLLINNFPEVILDKNVFILSLTFMNYPFTKSYNVKKWSLLWEIIAINSSWSEPQSAPGLVFANCIGLPPSLAAKNIINLILVLTIWWCLCAELSLVLLEEVFSMTSVFSWQNSVSLCPASFCTLRSNLPGSPGISWLPTFAF